MANSNYFETSRVIFRRLYGGVWEYKYKNVPWSGWYTAKDLDWILGQFKNYVINNPEKHLNARISKKEPSTLNPWINDPQNDPHPGLP